MSNEILELEPRSLWKHFVELNAVPRPSKKEERVIAFMQSFGERLGMETLADETGNLIIRKPATPGMENRVPIVMQGHVDMVHQKNAGTDFDFDNQGIEMILEGDWIRANGTTLGADNGIGVAAIMAVLASSDIPHPAIEALFTVDEESGMTGALGLAGGLLNGRILLNLDTEDDDEITIGCAGAVDVTATGTYTQEIPGRRDIAFKLTVKGLTGGHSGMDIHRGRGNATKLINRLLFFATHQCAIRISSIDAGGLRNAIPREAVARLTVRESRLEEFVDFINEQAATIKAEYAVTDPGLEVTLESAELPESLLTTEFHRKILWTVYACPNGVARMSPDIDDLVQTSNSLARVHVEDGQYKIVTLVRGSVDSEKMDRAQSIRCCLEMMGAKVKFGGAYPGWAPKPDAPIVTLLSDLYREMFQQEAKILACHAGLECGILGGNYPDVQMVSFGPNIRGAHSPDEKVQVSSVQKFWALLRETLSRIPVA
jgi:dipeptidase D